MAYVLLTFLLCAPLVSCVSDDVCGKEMEEVNGLCAVPKDTEPTAPLVTVQLRIPENSAISPSLLSVTFFNNATMSGMPSGFGEQISNPNIVPGQVLTISSSQGNLEGDYYMSIVLYCEGGGNGRGPVPGVDWVGSEIVPVTLGPGTGTVDIGELVLIPYQSVK